MAADEAGNDLEAISIPLTGNVGIAPDGTALATPIEMADRAYLLPAAFTKLGLLTQDGGPEWTNEADGDPIELWQDGYTIPNGLANSTVVMKLAESSPMVDELMTGTAPASGYSVVDAGGNPKRYVIWIEEVFKNGRIRRREGRCTVAIKEDKSERGAVLGYEATFKMAYDVPLGGHFQQQWIEPSGATPPPPAWQGETAYALNDRVTLSGGAVLKADVAGTSGTVEPTPPASVGDTVLDDGTVDWTRVS